MKQFILLRWPLLLCAIVISISAAAQQSPYKIISSKKTSDGRYNFIKFDATRQGQLRSMAQPDQLKTILGLEAKHSFVPFELANNNADLRRDPQGLEHVRYKQFFNNITVEYGVVTLHSKNGSINLLTGEYFNINESFSTSPALTEKAALSKAVSFIGARKYSWEDVSFSNNPLLKNTPKGELVICKNFLGQAGSTLTAPAMELAYKFAIYATEPLRYDYIYVSAKTGNIIHVNPIIKHANGTGATRYSGSKTIATTLTGSNYVLQDSGGNYNVGTYNMKRGTNYNAASNFTDNDNNWTAAEHNNSNYDNAAMDAHWGAMMTLDYWRTVHNRNSFDNKGSRVNSYVHFANFYSNAFWDGFAMTYGDGNGSTVFPFTSIDICGHEIGHAICEYTANLIYYNESGALNEGFSDIWGASIKRYADASKNTWLTGDEISTSGNSIRSMSNPKSKGQPDTYKGANWYTGSEDNGGVHYNSGVLNYWFYLLTEGKSGTNDKGTSYNVSGIGITKAAKIAYRAENLYLYPAAVYADARIFTIQAAEDLYGANSNEVIQTIEAWKAVGVNEVLARPSNITAAISNNNVVVNWSFNTFQSIDGFKIERAINGSNQFSNIAAVSANARSYTDTAYINNSINQYRLRSFKDTAHSDYSELASVITGNAPLIMTNGSFNTCGITFLDPGGQSNYSAGNYTTTVRPSVTGNNLKVVFSQFNVSYDYLYIYDGPSSSSPLLGVYSGTSMPPVIHSTAPGGELTFVFNAYTSNIATGWQASISCFKPVAAPSNLIASANSAKDVLLSWTDNANDETGYEIQRSINDTLHYLSLANLPANTTSYTDTSAPDRSYNFYRVRAHRDTVASRFSNEALVIIGNILLMQNGTVNACDVTFYDQGGEDYYKGGYYMTTIRPATTGNNVKIAFSQFNVGYDMLYIFDGTSNYSPFLGSFTGSTLPPVLESSAPGGELTFIFNPNSSGMNPGWQAAVSCFKPVVAPANLTAVVDSAKDVRLNWTDNANDETRYVVERSLNDSLHFLSLVNLAANTTSYKDTSAPDNSYVYYRVKAYRDSVASPSSNKVNVIVGNILVMQNITVNTCGITFFDPGGQGNYSSGYYSTTVRPAITGNNLKIVFSQFNVNYYDYLHIYDGPSTSSPLLGSYTGTNMPPVLKSSSPGGELTFVFNSYYSNAAPGWQAYISCFKPVAAPTNLNGTFDVLKDVNLTWTDNASDETGYSVERSLNDSLNFLTLATLSSNATSYKDASAPEDIIIYYRVRAFRDSVASTYSNTKSVINGTVYIMQNGVVNTCSTIFLDPGGFGNYNDYLNYTTTFTPAIAGNKLRVAFSSFATESCCDYLRVYDGPSTSYPLIGYFSGSSIPPVFESSAENGALTFQFVTDGSGTSSGWQANVYCYKPVSRPTNLTATAVGSQKVNLAWRDNSDDETNYVIERSVNAPSIYAVVARLPLNTTQYADTTAPLNSVLYYRIRAYRDTISSFYSDTAKVTFGDAPILMKDTMLITCSKIFMDAGGSDIIPPGIYHQNIATFKPSIAGNNLKVVFSKVAFNGTMYVYNGPSTNSPPLGHVGNSYPNNYVFESFGPDAALTFYYQGYAYNDSGWVAQVSCYKPVNKPTGLTATLNSSQQIRLTWTDNANDETKYVVERSVNAPSKYTVVAQLPSNTAQYIDSAAPLNSLLYYRVRAYRDTIGSFYSDTASRAFGNAPFLMMDSTVITCDKVFMDPGGVDIIPPNTYYYNQATIKPSVTGNNVRVAFSKFQFNGNLYVYNGSSTSSPLLATLNLYNQSTLVFEGTMDGSLTFVYQGGYTQDSGWRAQVTCYKPVAKPTGLTAALTSPGKIRLTWSDNADDETRYVVERSVSAPSLFAPIAELASNSTQFIDSTAPINSLLYYRVRAYRDTLGSFYSDVFVGPYGNAPFLMKDSTVITCDKVFMDPGGADIIPQWVDYYNTISTFKPAISGHNVKIVFSKFAIHGNLTVFNGSSINSPHLVTLNGYRSDTLVFEGTGPEGSLTFQFQQGSSYIDSGWLAKVSCYKPVAKPTGLKAALNSAQKIRLTWADNANDETRYVVERSDNAPSLYKPIAQLPSNTIQYVDSLAPANSLFYYRIKAYRDTLGSFYSDTASVPFGNAPFLMQDSTLITCDKVFMDPGGADIIPQTYFFNRVTFKPTIAGNTLKVAFSKIKIRGSLSVYNGSSINSPFIASLDVYSSGFPVFEGTGPEGSLTFVYEGSWFQDSGWVAQVSCFKRVPKPTGLTAALNGAGKVRLTWTDNATDETKYVVERSVNATSLYAAVAQLPASTTQFVDSTAPANSLFYYRVRAYRDTLGSFYSDTASISYGNAPFLMKDSTVVTCDKVFLDAGGADVISQAGYYNDVTATFKPAIAGSTIKVRFNKFSINGYLYVYNGSSTNSPYMGQLSGSNPYPTEFLATGPEGSLTFRYGGYSYQDSGWQAQVTCYKQVAPPTGLRALLNTAQRVQLTWTDNANDETKYVVERSVNAPLQYKPLAELPANTDQYTDTAAPANSLLYYRVRAFRDTSASYFSDTVLVSKGNAPFLMESGTVVTCDKVFMDPGGIDVIPNKYDGHIYTTTFKPATTGGKLRVTFSKYMSNSSMLVYNGPFTSSPYLGFVSSNYPMPVTFNSTSADGSLTFTYLNYGYGDSGWVAQVSCFTPVASPVNLAATSGSDSSGIVHLTWTDRATNETRYEVERSINDTLYFQSIANLSANATSYNDSSAPGEGYIYYRVRAFAGNSGSDYSNMVTHVIGNFYIMQNGYVQGCGTTFLDPGGFTNYNNNANYTTTFFPSDTGTSLKVVFTEFNTEACCDYLRVYNGPNTSYPLLGTFKGTTLPPSLQSTAPMGELTFVFFSDGSSTGSGWRANLSCIKINDTLAICSENQNDVNTLTSNITGTAYQWQRYSGNSFVNIYDDANYAGTTTATLRVKNAGLNTSEKFRCLVNGYYSRDLVVIKGNRWTGRINSDWNNAQNWSCATVPNANTDVLIEAGKLNNPVVNSNVQCRSLTLQPGVNLTIAPGYTLNIMH